MNLRWTPTTIIGLIAVIVFIILALAATKCSAQTAGALTPNFPYSAGVDRAMTKQHGIDWQNTYALPQLREAWKNVKSTAVEQYKAGMSSMFDEGIDPELITKAEGNTLQRIADSLAIRKARKAQREADSIVAAAKLVGGVINTRPEVYANVGKALSPRMAFLQDVGDSEPAPAPPSGLPFNEDAVITYIYVVHILAIVGLVAIGIWAIP